MNWIVEMAQDRAHELLEDSERYEHSRAVARRAETLSITVANDQVDLLVAAAWLHDIGYCAALRDTGFHPLDGARWLARRRADGDLVRLVAHHSGARFVAGVRGLSGELAQFPLLPGPTADALTAADQTIGPRGRAMSLDERMDDMLARHGADSPNAHAHANRAPDIRAAASRVAARLAGRGVTDPWLPLPAEPSQAR